MLAQRKEEASAFMSVYWNLLQDVLSGIVSSWTLPPPPLCDQVFVYCMWGGGDVLLFVESIRIQQDFYTLYICDQIQTLQNCFITQDKNLGGEGASHSCRKVLFQPTYKTNRFCFVFTESLILLRMLQYMHYMSTMVHAYRLRYFDAQWTLLHY